MAGMRTQPRKPKGSPNGTGGQYDHLPHTHAALPEPVRDVPDEGTLQSHRARREYYQARDRAQQGWMYMDQFLKASEPAGDGHDWTSQPVCSLEREMELVERAIGPEGRPGPVARKFLMVTGSPSQAQDLARTWVNGTLLALRRSCALDPTRCYSEPLVRAMLAPGTVKLERILAKPPYRLSAHRSRIGNRYRERLDAYKREHGRVDDRIRDRVWDETLADYVEEKMASGVSMGGGLYYSNGQDANPRHAHVRRAMEQGLPVPVRRNPDGSVFNGRADYERILADFRSQLHQHSLEADRASFGFDPAADEGRVDTSGVDLVKVFQQAARQGHDLNVLADTLHLDDAMRQRVMAAACT